MNNLKNLESAMMYKHGLIQKVQITRVEYEEKLRTDPQKVSFIVNGFDNWGNQIRTYFLEKLVSDMSRDDINRLIDLDNNTELNQIVRNVRTIKIIMIISLIFSFIEAFTLLIIYLTS